MQKLRRFRALSRAVSAPLKTPLLCAQVGELAKRDAPKQPAASQGDGEVQLEKLISTNRDQAEQIAALTRAAAQREAQLAQYQVQLEQAKVQAAEATRKAQEASQLEREQSVQQQQQLLALKEQQFAAERQKLHTQFQHGLAAASESQVAQQVIVGRLASFLNQIHQWLPCLASRCASQQVELPVECARPRPCPGAQALEHSRRRRKSVYLAGDCSVC